MPASDSNPLSAALGAPLPAGLDKLAPAECAHLADALERAKQRQREALKASTESALGHVPLLLRGAVRKVLLG